MEYLLVMSLSGSVMTCFYLLLRCLLKHRVSARLYYLLAKSAVLYYLIPLPFLKGWYKEALHRIMPGRQMEIVQVLNRWTIYVLHSGGKLYLNVYAKIQAVVAALWLTGCCLLLLVFLLDYLRTVRRIARYANRTVTDQQWTVLESLKEQYGVKRSVILYQGQDGERTMTFGFGRPAIVCGRALGSREMELIVCHEMVHIRRWDTLWQVLMQFVTFMYWWNPLMWMLYRDFERVCEWSCDEEVMQGKSEREVKEYLRLLIEEAQDEKKAEEPSLRWGAGFRSNARKLKERIENLMKRKRYNRLAAGVLVVVLAFANSITVFAYRDVYHETVLEGTSQEVIEQTLCKDITLFFPEGVGMEGEQTFVQGTLAYDTLEEVELQYERQFIDGEGNIYPVLEEAPAAVYRKCSHTYVSGELTDHIKKSDGGCEVIVYSAQRCSKCSGVIKGEEIKRTTYKVCPH